MDLGAVGWDGVEGPETNDCSGGFGSLAPLDAETRKKKLMGSEGVGTEDYRRGPKKQRSGSAVRSGVNAHNNNNNSSNNGSNSYNNCTLLFSEVPHHQPQQQMLCFSSSSPPHHKSEASFPNYYHNSSYARNAGYNPGCLPGVRGPFTPSQWMELEHQALIYKYMTANMAIPSNLIMPIKRALESAGLSPFTGWGSFHLGFSSNNDPEPGRCRRTDGKKWRCSRDAVADQKYCERHMNRGRHRSRKPVEGRTGNTAAAARRLVQPLAAAGSSPQPVVVLAAGADAQHLYQDKTSAATTHSNCSGVYLNKENVGGRVGNAGGLSMLSDTNTMDLKSSKQAPDTFSTPKHDEPISYQESEFGLVSSDPFLNPSHESSQPFLHSRCFGPLDKDPETPLSLRRFMDDWPKNQQSSRSPMSWPGMDLQSNQTQLSISIPANKVTLSPLRLSHELDPIEMGLGVGSDEPHNRQANWVPISWGATSVGGPLGEVLHTTSGHGGGSRNSSAFNLDGWDGGGDSPPMESSPTGVLQLQKTTPFGSLSNSSAGSSPRAQEGASLCNDFLVNAASRPSL